MPYCRNKKPCLITSVILGILLFTLFGIPGCIYTTYNPLPYIPPDADYIGISIESLNNAYFGTYRPPWLTDEIFEGKHLIIKDIVVKKDMLKSRTGTYTDTYIVVGPAPVPAEPYIIIGAYLIKPEDPSDLEWLRVGQVIDVAGKFVGWSQEHGLVVITNCLIELAGVLPLPLPGSETVEIPEY